MSPSDQVPSSQVPSNQVPADDPRAPANERSRGFQGRFSDGKNAKRHDAIVLFDGGGLLLKFRDRAPEAWPFASLATANTINAKTHEVLVTSSTAPGESVYVPSAAFASQLRERAPHLTTTRTTLRMARPGLILGGVVVAITAAIFVFDLSPSRAVANILPQAAKRTLGDRVLDDLGRGRARCIEPAGRAALDALTKRLQPNRAADAAPVLVLDWPLVNALALPGGTVVLTRGILNQASSAEELAGVLAHEIGHGIELHPEAGLVRVIGFSAILQFVTTGQSGTLANIGIAVAALSYGRNAEREADKHALDMMRAAGVAHRPFAGFFRKISKSDGGSDADKTKKKSPTFTLPDVLNSHPAPEERIRRIEEIADYPSTPALTPAQWTALKAICTRTEPAPGAPTPGTSAPGTPPPGAPTKAPTSASPKGTPQPTDSSSTGNVTR